LLTAPVLPVPPRRTHPPRSPPSSLRSPCHSMRSCVCHQPASPCPWSDRTDPGPVCPLRHPPWCQLIRPILPFPTFLPLPITPCTIRQLAQLPYPCPSPFSLRVARLTTFPRLHYPALASIATVGRPRRNPCPSEHPHLRISRRYPPCHPHRHFKPSNHPLVLRARARGRGLV
jgi:hypothetical protein